MGQFESFIGVNFWTALMTLGNFLLVLFVGKKFLYGPVLKMIKDRQTEIDVLNGKIAEYGAELGIPTPVCATLSTVVRAIQGNYDKQYLK